VYLSVSSDVKKRDIVPIAIADSGLRWHVRAFDRLNERLATDEQLTRIVNLDLVPHPAAEWPEGIEVDFDMREGRLKIRTRAPLPNAASKPRMANYVKAPSAGKNSTKMAKASCPMTPSSPNGLKTTPWPPANTSNNGNTPPPSSSPTAKRTNAWRGLFFKIRSRNEWR